MLVEKIKSSGLTWKFGVIVFVVLTLSILLMQFFLRRSVDEKFDVVYGSPDIKGSFVAELLANELKLFVKEDVNSLDVQQNLQHTIDQYYKTVYGMYGVRYILVLDESNFVLAHTFEGTVPSWLIEKNLLEGKKKCIPWKDTKDRLYHDCGVPLKLSDESTGAVRAGIYQQNPENAILQKIKAEHIGTVFSGSLLLISIILALLLAIVLTGVFWYFVIRRIMFLTEITEKMSFGELEVEIPVKTSDEIGLLEETMERMRANLREAIERLRERLKRRD